MERQFEPFKASDATPYPAYFPVNKTTQHLSTTGPQSPFTSQRLKIGIFEQFSDVHLAQIGAHGVL